MTEEIKWIKISVNMFTDDKIKQIRSMDDGNEIIIIWLQLLLLAGRINQDGMLVISNTEIPYTEAMLSNAFDLPLETVQTAMTVFCDYGMVEIIDDVYQITNWSKHQSVDGMDKIRELTRERVKRCRENKKTEKESRTTPLQRRFESFWRIYPKKVGKGAAERAFTRVKPDDALTEKMIAAIEKAKCSAQWKKENGQYIPNPATWLNQKRWEDELPQEPTVQPTLQDRGLEDWDDWK